MKCKVSLLSSIVWNAFKVKLTKPLDHISKTIAQFSENLSKKSLTVKAVEGIYTFSLRTLRFHSLEVAIFQYQYIYNTAVPPSKLTYLGYTSPLITNKALHIKKKIKAYNLILGCRVCTDHIVLTSQYKVKCKHTDWIKFASMHPIT